MTNERKLDSNHGGGGVGFVHVFYFFFQLIVTVCIYYYCYYYFTIFFFLISVKAQRSDPTMYEKKKMLDVYNTRTSTNMIWSRRRRTFVRNGVFAVNVLNIVKGVIFTCNPGECNLIF